MTITIPLMIVIGVLAWFLRPGKRPANPLRIAILATVIPPVVLAVAAVVFQLLHNAAGKTQVSDIPNTLYIAGLCLICAAILVLAGFAIKRRGEIAKAIGFGICIDAIVYIAEFGLLEWLSGV